MGRDSEDKKVGVKVYGTSLPDFLFFFFFFFFSLLFLYSLV